jgi:FdhD protein
MRPGSSVARRVEKVTVDDDGPRRHARRDTLATEEPLEIRVELPDASVHPIAVTMRTPGSDFELAAGFLYSEGIIDSGAAVKTIRYCLEGDGDQPFNIAKTRHPDRVVGAGRSVGQQYNVVTVHLAAGCGFDPASVQRNFYMTSSCGVCGKASIDAVMAPIASPDAGSLTVSAGALLEMPARLRTEQRLFDRTGGLHAAALFDADGELIRLREDVGRHNAMDKLMGSALLESALPLRDRVILVSGRLSFELVQKAARAGVTILAGVSAPSSLAVDLAEEAGITLVGFLRGRTFNIYTGADRIS